MLKKLLRKAIKVGGQQMDHRYYAKLFGNDEKLRRDVLHACGDQFVQKAILADQLADHRIIQAFRKMGPIATRIVIDCEAKRGRKLIRSRIDALAKAFCRIQAEHVLANKHSNKKPELRVIHAIRKAA